MKKVSTLLIKAFPYFFLVLILLSLLIGYSIFDLHVKFTFQHALESGAIFFIGTCTYTLILISSIFLTKEKIYE